MTTRCGCGLTGPPEEGVVFLPQYLVEEDGDGEGHGEEDG